MRGAEWEPTMLPFRLAPPMTSCGGSTVPCVCLYVRIVGMEDQA